MPAWLITVICAIGFAAMFAVVVWLTHSPHKTEQAVRIEQPSVESPGAAASAPGAAASAQPAVSDVILKNVEVTGLRLTEDAKQKTFIELVAVNHSAADLGDISATVALRSAGNKDAEPIATFPLKVSLGPFESKDVKMPVTTKLRAYEFPDWQFLRADFSH